jgi:hypothetical protein
MFYALAARLTLLVYRFTEVAGKPNVFSRLARTQAFVSLSRQNAKAKPATNSAPTRIVGIWRGNSVCLVGNSSCHDKVNVYRFTEVAGKPNVFSVTAAK